MAEFSEQLNECRRLINADIDGYANYIRQSTREQYGRDGAAVADAFFDMLERGGKRMRGALVMTGYQMCGGQDLHMIVRAATAIEMIQAALLTLDDIQDRSVVRRGKPTVHKMLESYYQKQGLAGDSAHTGVALALNAMVAGKHAALMLIGGLNVDAELRTKVLGIMSHTFIVTAHGQTADIMNESRPEVDEAAIDNMMEWKTAHYSVLNPLCVGMVLAGAGCEDTDAIRDYALHTGKAFQITDDIIGIFGDEKATGKSPMDDIREGKKTLLTVYALQHTTPGKVAFLRKCLGNPGLTADDFERCRHIIESSGARRYAEKRTEKHIAAALEALKNAPQRWHKDQINFLKGLVDSIQNRTN